MIFLTDDGSTSVKSAQFAESYHSKFGAVNESMCVFIRPGLQEWHRLNAASQADLRVFEMGFGTGLNAILAMQFAEEFRCPIVYHAIELFPLHDEDIQHLNHTDFIDKKFCENAQHIQHGAWGETLVISPFFTLYKEQISLLDIQLSDNHFDVIFFDAFSPNVQPELWTEKVFQKLYQSAKKNAILTTYCVKGDVRRALQTAGFSTEKIPGPVGKREILRGRK